MKIGIFTDCYSPQINGVVISVCMLEEELTKLGHDVTIITVKVPNYIDTKKNVIRIRSIPFNKWTEFRLGVPFSAEPYRLIKSLNLDLIHTHTEFSIGLFGKYMAKLLDIPIIHTYHTMYEDYTHYVYNLRYGKGVVKKLIIKVSKQYVKKYDGIIAPTDKTKSALLSYGVKNDIYVVPTGIDLRHFEHFSKSNTNINEIMEKYNLSSNDKIILSLGRISEEKSIDVIIKQMPLLINTVPNAKLIIVGDGPYKSKLVKLCTQLDIKDNVIFTGRVPFDNVSFYYSIADLFISASKTETQGLTIMEAMASDVPVIVYNDTNVKDIVVKNKSGRLFETPEELTQCIIDTFTMPEETIRMTKEASEIVKTLSKEAYGKNAENVYSHLISSQSNN